MLTATMATTATTTTTAATTTTTTTTTTITGNFISAMAHATIPSPSTSSEEKTTSVSTGRLHVGTKPQALNGLGFRADLC